MLSNLPSSSLCICLFVLHQGSGSRHPVALDKLRPNHPPTSASTLGLVLRHCVQIQVAFGPFASAFCPGLIQGVHEIFASESGRQFFTRSLKDFEDLTADGFVAHSLDRLWRVSSISHGSEEPHVPGMGSFPFSLHLLKLLNLL